MNELLELDDLIKRIKDWSKSLGLDSNSDPFNQNLKLMEEVGEFAKSVQNGDVLGQMDGLGDIAVVTTVMATQLPNYENALLLNTKEPLTLQIGGVYSTPFECYFLNKTLNRYTNYCVDMHNSNDNVGTYLCKHFTDNIRSLVGVAESLNLNFNQCVKMAYSTIHFRSGEIIDGIFVKHKPDVNVILPVKILKEDIDTIINSVLYYVNNNGFKYFKVEFDLNSEFITHK